MTFNNRRILHSRKHFTLNGGQRHLQVCVNCIEFLLLVKYFPCDIYCLVLQGAYVNIDHFKSTYEVLCKQLGKTEVPIRRVFNVNSS